MSTVKEAKQAIENVVLIRHEFENNNRFQKLMIEHGIDKDVFNAIEDLTFLLLRLKEDDINDYPVIDRVIISINDLMKVAKKII